MITWLGAMPPATLSLPSLLPAGGSGQLPHRDERGHHGRRRQDGARAARGKQRVRWPLLSVLCCCWKISQQCAGAAVCLLLYCGWEELLSAQPLARSLRQARCHCMRSAVHASCTARCRHHPLVCRGPTGNAEAKYQEISDTEKPHFPLGEQSVSDKVGAASANNGHGRWRKLGVVTAQGFVGAFMQLLFVCWVCADLAICWPATHPQLLVVSPPSRQFPDMHEAASLQSNTPEGQKADSERIRYLGRAANREVGRWMRMYVPATDLLQGLIEMMRSLLVMLHS